jgi:hypothetical protein
MMDQQNVKQVVQVHWQQYSGYKTGFFRHGKLFENAAWISVTPIRGEMLPETAGLMVAN